jgi:hypothetical protein
LPNGNDGLLLEGRPPHTPGAQLTGTGRRYELHDVGPITYDGPGTGTPEQRCREQDQDGIDAEVMYTHPIYPRFWRGIRDDEPYRAMFYGYNEWLGTEYCGSGWMGPVAAMAALAEVPAGDVRGLLEAPAIHVGVHLTAPARVRRTAKGLRRGGDHAAAENHIAYRM